jgi:hypothetical protein
MNKQEKELDTGKFGQLSQKQQRLIPFVCSAHTVEEGCRRAGVSTVTFYEYLKDPVFSGELKKARESAVCEAMENLKSATTKAVDQLVALLDSVDENVRRRASVDILTFVTKWRELNEVESRLESIERVVLERRTYQHNS